MRPDLQAFPQPPPQSALRISCNDDTVTITNVPNAAELAKQLGVDTASGERALRAAESLAPVVQHGASCMAAVFQGFGWLMLLLGAVFFALIFVVVFVYDTPFNINGHPADREAAAWVLVPFAALWIGFCVLWLYLVRRTMFSPDKLDSAWILRLGPEEWIGTRSYGGKTIGRCRTQDIERVMSGQGGRLLACTAGKLVPLTGPMAGSESTWLTAATLQAIDSHRRAELGSLPFIPKLDPRISAGKRLRYRLPRGDRPWREACAWSTIALIWNALTWGGLFTVWNSEEGWSALFPLLLLTLFVLVGIVLLAAAFFTIYKAIAQSRTPATIVELSELPLVAGQAATGFISQAGNGDLKNVAVSVLCQEETTYTEGTSTRTEVRPIWKEEVFTRDNVRVRPDRPLEANFDILVPPDAVHSLELDRNKIVWKLMVNIDTGRFVCLREFPVVVAPRVDEGAASDRPDDQAVSGL